MNYRLGNASVPYRKVTLRMLRNMPSHTSASEVLMALGALAVAQEEERSSGELDALTGSVMSALDGFRESRSEVAA